MLCILRNNVSLQFEVGKMNKFLRFLLIFCCCLGCVNLIAQSFSTLRKKIFIPNSCEVKIDSLVVLKNSFRIEGVDTTQYQFDELSAQLLLKDSSLLNQPLVCIYRVFNTQFKSSYSSKSTDLIYPKITQYSSRIVDIEPFRQSMADENSVLVSGSISRGISAGSNVDLGLTSSLNLQLSGMLAPNLKILANISDKNVPIQPDGNTRVIQDFDRVFITLQYKDALELNAGDVVITSPKNHFLQFNKKILGLSLLSTQSIKKDFLLKNRVGGGISKGKFYRQKLAVMTGVQGPYRLVGPYNNAALVILSGSERVYMDNKLLTRGADADYIIDYNLGEISFTPRVLVSTEREFIVEYEYSDNAYSRYTFFTFNEWVSPKNPTMRLYLHYFREQDLKNHSYMPELTRDMKMFLSQQTDLDQLYYPHVDSVNYSENEILYEQIDTLCGGDYYTIYRYSTSQHVQLYRVGFLYVGENRGEYQVLSSSANGRVFQWVAPLNGVPQGNYSPVMQLFSPISAQMGVVGWQWDFSSFSTMAVEAAFSAYDANTFSLSNTQNVGYALKLHLNHKNPLQKRSKIKPWWFFTNLKGEFLHKNFYHFESFREVDFYKDFNLDSDFSEDNHELMLHYQAGFQHQDRGKFLYNAQYYSRFGLSQAFRNELVSSIHINGWKYSMQTSLLQSWDTLFNTSYIRSRNDISKQLRRVVLGAFERFELNRFLNAEDSLLENSFLYNEAMFYVKNADSVRTNFQFSYTNIVKKTPYQHFLQMADLAHQIQLQFDLMKWKNSRLGMVVNYRNSRLRDVIGDVNSENFFTGSVDYSGRYLKNALVLSTYYEAGSGLEQKKCFSFLKVFDGQGTHVWNDYNANGIEEINEFEVAAFQDQANYLKVWTLSSDYVNTHNTQFLQKVHFRPANLWKQSRGMLKFLSRFSNMASLRIVQKNTIESLLASFNPFLLNVEDSLLVSSQVNFLNTLSFNQNSALWGADYTYKYVQNKQLNFYGSEAQSMAFHEILLRTRISKRFLGRVIYQYNLSRKFIPSFCEQNYLLATHSATTSLQYQVSKSLDMIFFYLFSHQINRLGIERNIQNQIKMECNFRMVNRGTFVSKIQYVNMNFIGNENQSVSYQILEGFKPGHNFAWSLLFQMKLSDFLQLDLKYEGRASQNIKVVHTGFIQVKALF